jgi:hypothetical protein
MGNLQRPEITTLTNRFLGIEVGLIIIPKVIEPISKRPTSSEDFIITVHTDRE